METELSEEYSQGSPNCVQKHHVDYKKMKKMVITDQNVLETLNNIKEGLCYELESQTGSKRNPPYKYSVDINGEKVIGFGGCKIQAKRNVAAKALQKLVDQRQIFYSFTFKLSSSSASNQNGNNNIDNSISSTNSSSKNLEQSQTCIRSNPDMVITEQNILETLYKIKPGLSCESEFNPNFKFSININGKKVFGIAETKKQAKINVAAKVLQKLVDEMKISHNFEFKISKTAEKENVPKNLEKSISLNNSREKILQRSLTSAQSSPANHKIMVITNQNILETLNIIKPGLNYVLDHCPTFKLSVEINGEKVIGVAETKRQAIINMAAKALQKLVEQKKISYNLVFNLSLCASNQNGINNMKKFASSSNSTTNNLQQNPTLTQSNPENYKTMIITDQNVLETLYNIKPEIRYELEIQTCVKSNPLFTYSVAINGEKVVGISGSKRQAKLNVAAKALHKLVEQKKISCNLVFNLSSSASNQNGTNNMKKSASSSSSITNNLQQNPTLTQSNPENYKTMIITDQNILETFHSIKPGIRYELETQSGVKSNPLFTYSVVINGEKVAGVSGSKRQAKLNVAAKALQKLVEQKKISCNLVFNLSSSASNQNGTNNMKKSASSSSSITNNLRQNPTLTQSNPENYKTMIITDQNILETFHSIKPGIRYELETQTCVKSNPLFTYSVDINGEKVVGVGGSKRQAKLNVAAKALQKLVEQKKISCNLVFNLSSATTNQNGTNNMKKLASSSNSSTNNLQQNQTLTQCNPENYKTIFITDQNVLETLQNIKPGIRYEFEPQTGVKSNQFFTYSIDINGEKVFGVGRTKRLAKINVAAKALQKLVDQNQVSYIFDFALSSFADGKENETSTYEVSEQDMTNRKPIGLINELYDDVTFKTVLYKSMTDSNTYMASINISSSFVGTGSSKVNAITAAAKEALVKLHDLSFGQKNSCGPQLDEVHANKLATLVNNKYEELTCKYLEQYSARKVIAGLVMTKNMSFSNAKIIAITSGSKVLSGKSFNLDGTVLNDMHAEIVLRRCFIKYLYTELGKYFNQNSKDTIFYVKVNSDDKFKLKVRDNIQFHMYISTAPCGDAAIDNRKNLGILRSKIEAGEGTIPINVSIQTWDGIQIGERALTMSCSDKLTRWNVLGLQGALLATVMDPIYLHSLVLGNLFHPTRTYHALCGRIENVVKNLPKSYQLAKPNLATISSNERRISAKTNYSVNWTIGDENIEIVSYETGKVINDGVSELAKVKFFERYQLLCNKIPQLQSRQDMVSNQTINYGELKLMSLDFQNAKKQLFTSFKEINLGNWLKKPIEQDQFYSIVESN